VAVLKHSLDGFECVVFCGTEFAILRQIIDFATAIFVFLADYSVNKDKILGVKVCTDGCL